MAKKKTAEAEATTETKPVAKTATGMAVRSIKMTEEFLAWLDSYAKHRRVSVTKLLEDCVVESAKKDGFEPAPLRTIR